MLKIGEFSKLVCITVKALRFYDQEGLLKPAHVDSQNGYRLYDMSQVAEGWKIVTLKELGLSLPEIAEVMTGNPTFDQIRGMLTLKKAQQKLRIEEETAKLERVEHLLDIIQKEGAMPQHDVATKTVEEMTIVSFRGIFPTYMSVGEGFMSFPEYLKKHNVTPLGPAVCIYHDPEYKEKDYDIEGGFPVGEGAPNDGKFSVRKLPKELVASTIHTGTYEAGFHSAYKDIMDWMERNGYEFAGPPREVYLSEGSDGKLPVTEIMIPIAKR